MATTRTIFKDDHGNKATLLSNSIVGGEVASLEGEALIVSAMMPTRRFLGMILVAFN